MLLGLAKMLDMRILSIPGVTGDVHNDYAAQMHGAMLALRDQDLVVAHVEAPDEAGHDGSVDDKVRAIECIDTEMVSTLRALGSRELRVLVAPDHPTPIKVRTHVPEPVPFLLWGSGVQPNGAARFTECEAARPGLFIDDGADLMARFVS